MAMQVHGGRIEFTYKNHRGEVAQRHVLPVSIDFKATQWHPKQQWIMDAIDLDKNSPRSFAMKDMSDVRDIPK